MRTTPTHHHHRTPRVGGLLAAALLSCALGCATRQPIVVRDDVAITDDVKARLAADPHAGAAKIDVVTTAGVVRLTGDVSSDVQRDSAERIAREAPGVRSVDNSVTFGMIPKPGGAIAR